MSVNYNDGRIISLYDFVNNLDSNYTALNERIFIIVYFFSLKYCQQRLTFNENSLNFVEDSSFPWGFRLELTEIKKNYSCFDPEIFKFIYNGRKNLNTFLNDIMEIIKHLINNKTIDGKTFILKETEELLKSKKNGSLYKDYSKICSLDSMGTISASKNDLHSKYY
jgi:hypothetical protein